jgi:copper transport protein
MRRCLPIVAAFVALVLQTGAAFAHASLVDSNPVDGAVLSAAPSTITLTFDEPVSPLVLTLVEGSGTSSKVTSRVEGNNVIVDVPPTAVKGSYVLSWRVVSLDGHPVKGSVVFSVGAPSATPALGAVQTDDTPLRVAIWICRLAIYLGLFIGIGGLFFEAFVARAATRARPLLRGALLVGLIGAPISLGLQGLDALGLSFAGLVDGAAWQTGMSTSYGPTVVIAEFALAIALIASALPANVAGRVLSLVSFIGIGVALAASGHASAAHPPQTRIAVFVHTIGVAFWIGALLPLAASLRDGTGALPLTRFSRAIPFALVPLVAAGVALVVVQVGNPNALLTTAYGRVLTLKLVLVIALFIFASINRWRLTLPAESGDRSATRRLVLAIGIEAALAVAILADVSTWRFTPPPRAIAAAAVKPAFVHIHTEKAMAEVTLTPGQPGPVVATIALLNGDFGPLEAKEVTLSISNPSAGIEPIDRKATLSEDGVWHVKDLIIPMAGTWNVDVAILISDFEMTRLDGTIDVRP